MPKYNVPEGHYTVCQAAKVLGVTPKTVRLYINSGDLEAKAVNEGTPHYYRLISQEALDAYLKKRYQPDDHLYEIICISCGKTEVLFSTHSLMELSLKYTRMVENDHKLVRIRLDGVPLLIYESDRLGYTYHPRTKKGIFYGKVLERGKGSIEGYIPRDEQGRVQHGEEPAVLRRGAHGPGEDDQLRDRAQARAPEEPVPAVPQGRQGTVQGGPKSPEWQEHPGVPARPGRKRRLTDEERKLRARERNKRWRQENPEKAREMDRKNYYSHREKRLERSKLYAKEHREQMNAYARKYYRKKKEEANNDPGTKDE